MEPSNDNDIEIRVGEHDNNPPDTDIVEEHPTYSDNQDVDFDAITPEEDDPDASTIDDDTPGLDAQREIITMLDSTTYGAVKDGDMMRSWEIHGLMENGKPVSPLRLRMNPPKMVFRSMREPYHEEYTIILDPTTTKQMHDALSNVINVYKARPIKQRNIDHSWRGFIRRMTESFEDNPAAFIFKAVGALAIIVLLIMAVI